MVRFIYGITVLLFYGLSFIFHPKRTYRLALAKEGGKTEARIHIYSSIWVLLLFLSLVCAVATYISGPLSLAETILIWCSCVFGVYSVFFIAALIVILKPFNNEAKY